MSEVKLSMSFCSRKRMHALPEKIYQNWFWSNICQTFTKNWTRMFMRNHANIDLDIFSNLCQVFTSFWYIILLQFETLLLKFGKNMVGLQKLALFRMMLLNHESNLLKFSKSECFVYKTVLTSHSQDGSRQWLIKVYRMRIIKKVKLFCNILQYFPEAEKARV